jgi:hypothetical protein
MKSIIRAFATLLTSLICFNAFSQFGNENVSKSFAMVVLNNGSLHLNISNRDENGYTGYVDTVYKFQDYKTNDKAMEAYAAKAMELLNICRLDYNVPTKYTNLVISPQIVALCAKKGNCSNLINFNALLKSKLADVINDIYTISDDDTKKIFFWGEMPSVVNNGDETKSKLKLVDAYFKKVKTIIEKKDAIKGADLVNEIEANTYEIFEKDFNLNSFKTLGFYNKNEFNVGGSLLFSILSFVYPEKLKQPTLTLEVKDIDKFFNNLIAQNDNNIEQTKNSINSLSIAKKDRDFTSQTQSFVKKMYTYNEILAGTILLKKIMVLLTNNNEAPKVIYNNNTMAEQLFGASVIKANIKTTGYSISKN